MRRPWGVDYRTIMHHANVLRSNSLKVTAGERYAAMYFLSPRLEAGVDVFAEICVKLRFRFGES